MQPQSEQVETWVSGGPDVSLAELAARVERELGDVAFRWDHLPLEERAETARSLAARAPGVLNLLCPSYGRFNPLPRTDVAPGRSGKQD